MQHRIFKKKKNEMGVRYGMKHCEIIIVRGRSIFILDYLDPHV